MFDIVQEQVMVSQTSENFLSSFNENDTLAEGDVNYISTSGCTTVQNPFLEGDNPASYDHTSNNLHLYARR